MARTTSARVRELILRLVAQPGMRPEPGDEVLLERFVRARDEDAFEAILRRHGPMVLDVCRATLGNDADADDAFQATFLVLAARAGTIRQADTLAGWLSGVAHRTALKARACAALRRRHEANAPARAADPDTPARGELRRVVYEELAGLSERHRVPLVLCYLQGQTHDQAAAYLGLSKGTLKRRLARGRDVLRVRLTRRGVALPAAGLAAVLGPAARAAPARLLTGVLGAVAGAEPAAAVLELVREGLNGMTPSLRPLVQVAAVLVFAIGATAGLLVAGGRPPADEPKEQQPAAKAAEKVGTVDEQLARQQKFVVTGRVVSADGKTPLEGVTVRAHSGIATGFQTGETKSDANGRFRLIFTSGVRFAGGTVGGWAIVSVRKTGWYGWSYGWPCQYTLSDRPLDPRDVPARTTNLVPGKTSSLEFRMQPAAALTARLVDGAGKPLPNLSVWLTGKDLPPGSSVVASGKTDAAGVFTAVDVPRSTYRLVVEDRAAGRGELELGSIHFADAADYEAVATIREWGPRGTDVSFKVMRGRDR